VRAWLLTAANVPETLMNFVGFRPRRDESTREGRVPQKIDFWKSCRTLWNAGKALSDYGSSSL